MLISKVRMSFLTASPQACIRSYRVYEAQGDYSKMTDYER